MSGFDITQRQVTAGGVSFAILEAGEGPLALCLHGFPDTAKSWSSLLTDLAAAGYHAVAPFTRGYAPTSVPSDGNYTIGALAADACALHDVLGGDERAVLIGHDWGAGAAYAAAVFSPERWSKLVLLAVPPTTVAMPYMGTYDQLKRSWYMSICASPYGQFIASANDFEFIDRLWQDWSPGFDATATLADVHATFAVPESLTAALAYYKAALDPSTDLGEFAAENSAGMSLAPQPTLYLHGANDGCIGSDVAHQANDYLTSPGSRVEVIEDAGHFLHIERPEVVNKAILEHLTQ